jgi:hypothetical protein
MKQNLLLSILCIGLLFTSASCSDDDSSDNGGVTTAKDFIDKKKDDTKQVITVNTSQLPKTITLDEGVKILVKDGTFTKDGLPVQGDITLEVYEMLKPSSIIFSGTNTNYMGYMGNRYFETDGFIYINAKQNGKELDQLLTKNLIISIPTDKENDAETQLWTGDEDARVEVEIQGNPQFAWRDMGEGDIAWNDSVPNQKFNSVWARDGVFQFSFGRLGWVNCDVFWGEGKEMTTLTAELTGEVGTLASYMGYEGDTFVFFCGKGIPVVAQLYTPVNATTVKSYDDSMPVGVSGKLIAFSVREGKFSYASKDIIIEKDMKVTLDLKVVSKTSLENSIKSIDTYSK